MAVPDFVIAGAQKAGTSTLFELLSAHPDVHRSPVKEPHFFCVDPLTGRLPWRGPYDQRIFAGAVTSPSAYVELFADAAGRLTGDASTGYLADPEVPGRLAAARPDVKVIVILRDPVLRAFSAWKMWRRVGFEPLQFADALEAEEERRAAGWSSTYRYLANGDYADQLDRWRSAVGSSKLHLITTDSLQRSQRLAVAGVTSFLDISPPREAAEILHVNVGGAIPRSYSTQQLLRRRGVGRRILHRLPKELATTIHARVRQINSISATIDPTLEVELRARFASQLDRLEADYGLDVAAWRGPAGDRHTKACEDRR